jgi:phage terminase small subunit
MKLAKLNKQQIKESLEQTPAHVLLGAKRQLTHKQKTFCKGIVEGLTKTEAYDKAYNFKGKRKTMSDEASRLAKDPRISAEIEALERAKEFNALYSSAQLRTLVISQLTKEAVDPTSKASERIAALGKLGQVAELGVFVQRTETTVIKDSASARTELMEQLKKAMNDQMRTVNADNDDDAQDLLELLSSKPPASETDDMENPPEGDPRSAETGGSHILHSNPDKRFQSDDKQPQDISETTGVGGTKNSMCAPSTDTEEDTPLNSVKEG